MLAIKFWLLSDMLDTYLCEDFDGKDEKVAEELERLNEMLSHLQIDEHTNFNKIAEFLDPSNYEELKNGEVKPIKGVKINDAVYIASVIGFIGGFLHAENTRIDFYDRPVEL